MHLEKKQKEDIKLKKSVFLPFLPFFFHFLT